MNAEEYLKKFPKTPLRNNCLTDIACPECGKREEFRILMATIAPLRDAGTGDHEDTDWDEDSYIQCVECKHEGIASQFTFSGIDDLIESKEPSGEPELDRWRDA